MDNTRKWVLCVHRNKVKLESYSLLAAILMKIIPTIKGTLADPLATFKYFERLIATFCIIMPLILWLADGTMPHAFRPSISNYVYMANSFVFGMLLCIAAMLFIFNGAVYYKNETSMHISWHGQWYNIVLGVSLMGVICFPHKEYPIPHFTCAGLFFLGNAVVSICFHKDKDKGKSILLGILTVAALPLAFMHVISVLVAEWISLSVIGIHFMLSTIDMNAPVNEKKKKQ
jgi:hypothetical protein